MSKPGFVMFVMLLFCGLPGLHAQNYFAVDSLKKKAANAPLYEKAVYYNQISWMLRNSQPEQAGEYGKKAIEAAKESENFKELAKAYSFTGVAYRNAGDFNQALDFYDLGKQVAKEHELTVQYGYSFINIANAYLYLEEFERALRELDQADSIATLLNDTAMLSYCRLNRGRISLGKNDLQQARADISEALVLRQTMNNETGQAVCYKYLADIDRAEGKTESALANYDNALNRAGVKFDIDLLADIYDSRAEIFLKKGFQAEALTNADTALILAKLTKNPVRIRAAYLNLSDIFKTKKNSAKALEYMDFAMKYTDTMYQNRLREKVAYIKYDNEMEQSEQTITALEKDRQLKAAELQHERMQRWAFAAAALFILAVLMGAVLVLRQRKKDYAVILEKNRLISEQNEQLHQRNEEISAQRDEIELQKNAIEKQKTQIDDSILYAERIQNAALPKPAYIDALFPYNFVLFIPRDIVSGDFYYFQKVGKYIVAAAADCTGHGVPGAFVSMLGISLLNEITENKQISSPDQILEELRRNIKYSLQQSTDSSSQDDGMDMALSVINTETLELEFAGANNPLYIVRNNKLIELKPTLNPVGIYFREKPFKKEHFQLQENDTLYMFSDGYADQFGGDDNRRFMASKLKDSLLSLRKHPMPIQRNMLKQQFLSWKGQYKQIDDVMILGLKIAELDNG